MAHTESNRVKLSPLAFKVTGAGNTALLDPARRERSAEKKWPKGGARGCGVSNMINIVQGFIASLAFPCLFVGFTWMLELSLLLTGCCLVRAMRENYVVSLCHRTPLTGLVPSGAASVVDLAAN